MTKFIQKFSCLLLALSILLYPMPVFAAGPVTEITVTPETLGLKVGETSELPLAATVLPPDADDPTYTWSSETPGVADVDSSGNVTAIAVGTAIIKATAKDGSNVSGQCTVTVTAADILVESISVTPETLGLKVGETSESPLAATVSPPDADDPTYTWSSETPGVADVDSSGNVTAIAVGTAIIKATAKDGSNVSGQCTVTVTAADILVESISVTPETLGLKVGETSESPLAATVLPPDADDPTYTWSSETPGVADVDSSGNVTAIAVGTAIIKATAKDGSNVSGQCTVTVTAADILVESISVTPETLGLKVGETSELPLAATVLPPDADDLTYTWSSETPGVADVDSSGNVTAIAVGTAIIKATANDGSDVSGQCTVTVTAVPPTLVTAVIFDETEMTLNKGKYKFLEATVDPIDATQPELEWESSDETVATVSDLEQKQLSPNRISKHTETKQINAVGPGTATITAKATDGSDFFATCTVTVVIPVTGVELDETELDLLTGKEGTLTATVEPEDATDKSLIWSTDEEDVATVVDNQDGTATVTAVGAGTATITVKTNDGDFEATCDISVTDPVLVTNITLAPTEKTLKATDTQSITATVMPENATDKTLEWSSDKPDIATVDKDGLVTAVAVGSATITAAAKDGSGVEATCTITVEPTPVESIAIKEPEEMTVGETQTLIPTIQPESATNQEVTWASSNKTIATITPEGVVTALAVGETTITAGTTDGSTKTATCIIKVVPTLVSKVSVKPTLLELVEGHTETLTATVLPADATDKSVKWSSANEDIATVDEDTGEVTAVAEGVTIITATAKDGGQAAGNCAVAVVPPVLVDSITVQPDELTLVEGETKTLTATVLPDDATDKSVKWSSGNKDIATVDEDTGEVTAVAEGIVDIIAEAQDGSGKSGTCTVTVVATIPTTGVSVSPATLELTEGETGSLTATVLPANATDKTVTWSTDDDAIATVDANGKVTAVAAGTATITAKTNDGDFETACVVTVIPATVLVTGVAVSPTTLELEAGKTSILSAIVSPSNATNQGVTWRSSNNAVATVSAAGTVTAVAEGTATITVTTMDGDFEAACTVTVAAAIPPNTPESLTNDLYRQVLGRAPDADGMAFWANELKSGSQTVADVVDFFFLGAEYAARQQSNEAFIRDLYIAILGREADAEGLAYWVKCLEQGNTRRGLLGVFVQQAEFADICAQHGLQQGAIEPQQPADRNQDLTRFVHRMYAKALGRSSEPEGLNHWCGSLLAGDINPQQLAESFLLSEEFITQNHSDESFVRIMYATFMDREPDADGLAYWMNQLTSGAQRRSDLITFFANCDEFKEISASFGLA